MYLFIESKLRTVAFSIHLSIPAQLIRGTGCWPVWFSQLTYAQKLPKLVNRYHQKIYCNSFIQTQFPSVKKYNEKSCRQKEEILIHHTHFPPSLWSIFISYFMYVKCCTVVIEYCCNTVNNLEKDLTVHGNFWSWKLMSWVFLLFVHQRFFDFILVFGTSLFWYTLSCCGTSM